MGEARTIQQSIAENARPAWIPRRKRTPVRLANDNTVERESAPKGLRADGRTGLSSFGLSITLHTIGLLILAFLWLPMESPRNALSTDGDLAASSAKRFDLLPQVTLKANDSQQQQQRAQRNARAISRRQGVSAKLPNAPPAPVATVIADDSPGQVGLESAGGSKTRGADFGKNAVAFGPFKVWADPATPEINKPYSIWIRVKVPKSQHGRYAPGDLSGRIEGNDSQISGSRYADYSQNIPWDQSVAASGHRDFRRHAFYWHLADDKRFAITRRSLKRKYPVKGEFAYIEIKVPGAKVARVEDIVTVRSAMWNLEHKFRLVFSKQRSARRRQFNKK